jgi:hypothetical protein
MWKLTLGYGILKIVDFGEICYLKCQNLELPSSQGVKI